MLAKRIVTCLTIIAVFYAITALATAILDAFVEMPLLDELFFRSPAFHILLFAAFSIAAWMITARKRDR